MAKKTVDALKQFFMTGKKPTQQQFWDWLDSFRHKDDKIAFDDLSDDLKVLISSSTTTSLQELTISAPSSFGMAAKQKIAHISIKNNSATAMANISFTGTSFEVIPAFDLAANEKLDFDVNLTFWADDTITVNNVTNSITLLIDRK
jgi:hypothetical protein